MERVTVCLVVLLAFWIGMVRMQTLMAGAEASNVSNTVNRLTSALMLTAATRLVRGDQLGLAALANANPMKVMQYPPTNYAGEVDTERVAELPSGQWYFDLRTETLAYRFDYPPRDSSGAQWRFRTQIKFDDRGNDGAFDPERDQFTGIVLTRVD